MDSEDEREAAELEESKSYRLQSQMMKKAQKNKARLPRTAALRTLTDLTDSLTKAGYDPSRIQDRAEIIAKVQGAKRKRRGNDEEMDVDMDGAVEGDAADEGDWMDVDDGEETTPKKRAKTNTGDAVAVASKSTKREPRSNRLVAGMRDTTVGYFISYSICTKISDYTMWIYSKHLKPLDYVTSDNASVICMQERVRVTELLKLKW